MKKGGSTTPMMFFCWFHEISGRFTFLYLDGKDVLTALINPQAEQFIQFPRTKWFCPFPFNVRNRKMETTGGEICNLCGYSTPNASNLRVHKMIHTGEKPYQCGNCDFSCTKAGNLKTHSYTHTGEKPYQCGSCDFSCFRTDVLKRHIARHK